MAVTTVNNQTNVSINDVALVFVGGSIGTLLRYSGQSFFFSHTVIVTFVINLIGTFALGLLNGFVSRPRFFSNLPRVDRLRLFFGTGICGGFTTYSLFALQLQETANAWVLVSVPLGLLLFVVGDKVGHQ